MQMFDGINDRSILPDLISMGSWLIVLLLCNYTELTQGLESPAEGRGGALFNFLPLWPRM